MPVLFLRGSHGNSSHFGGDKEKITVKCLLELTPAPTPFSEEYFIVPHDTGVWVRNFSKKYLLSLKIHRFLNLLCAISPYKTYHHHSLTCGYCTFYKVQGTFWPQLKIAIYWSIAVTQQTTEEGESSFNSFQQKILRGQSWSKTRLAFTFLCFKTVLFFARIHHITSTAQG